MGVSCKFYMLEASKIYFLKGALFSTNTKDTLNNKLYFEGTNCTLLGNAESFTSNMEDMIGLSGIVRVLDIGFKVEECWQFLKDKSTNPDLSMLCAMVQNCNFHPELGCMLKHCNKLPQSFNLGYHIPPYKHLLGSPQIVKKGQECNFHVYIEDFNEETLQYVVLVNKVAPTLGHQEVTTKAALQDGNLSVPNARTQSKKLNVPAPNTPFKSLLTAYGSSSGVPLVASDTTLSLAASASTEAKSKGKAPSQPTKKRACATPKRKATRENVINESSEEI
ncbi:uncharacterized protein MELLADRAFT_95141 [Melampsora larici-populina 98AG31]|uniref:Uncharacterized protein n=1 Tax=Melampsora larici-populina (strain 98AG31 / pathotype 3-4-7) TaxID=747676 RepID=F4RC95_MELLP|nr:uncharacterized protein MELLADRAFT_95141 [Melampsora larici-populina 98AG31]EGG09992.1 hypothetical protein MELLADRAFT_95141 [Melampsora larici-populina 98AG31]